MHLFINSKCPKRKIFADCSIIENFWKLVILVVHKSILKNKKYISFLRQLIKLLTEIYFVTDKI